MEKLFLGIPTGEVAPRLSPCGGALLRLDDAALRELKRAGVRFKSQDKFGGDLWTARVQCERDCDERGGYRMALCFGCSDLESRMRELLKSAGTR